MHEGKKGFHSCQESRSRRRKPRKCLVKKVLTPPLIAMPDQPHKLPGSMQRERPGPPRQLQPRLFRRAVALAVIAAVAACYQVLPGGPPPARSRHHVV